jgi:hypothetical protein
MKNPHFSQNRGEVGHPLEENLDYCVLSMNAAWSAFSFFRPSIGR